MAARHSSKQAKSKAEAQVDRGATTKPRGKSNREPQPRNPRVRSPSGAARTDRAEATAAASQKANLNRSEMVHDKPQQARSRSKPTAQRADLGTTSASDREQPPPSPRRAKLTGIL